MHRHPVGYDGVDALVFTPPTPMHLDQRCRAHRPRAAPHNLCGAAPVHRCHICKVISGTPLRAQDPQHRVPLPENPGTGIRAVLRHAPRLAQTILTHFLSLVLAYFNNQVKDNYVTDYVGTQGAPPQEPTQSPRGKTWESHPGEPDAGSRWHKSRRRFRSSPNENLSRDSRSGRFPGHSCDRKELRPDRTRAKPQVLNIRNRTAFPYIGNTKARAARLGSSR